MSWDILIQDLPDVASVANIPGDFRPASIGHRNDLISRIQELIPQIDFSDPTWGIFKDDQFSIEFNIGPEEICSGIMLHVRGGGEAVTVISYLLKHLNLRALDFQSGEFFSSDLSEKSFADWQKFRDHAIQKSKS